MHVRTVSQATERVPHARRGRIGAAHLRQSAAVPAQRPLRVCMCASACQRVREHVPSSCVRACGMHMPLVSAVRPDARRRIVRVPSVGAENARPHLPSRLWPRRRPQAAPQRCAPSLLPLLTQSRAALKPAASATRLRLLLFSDESPHPPSWMSARKKRNQGRRRQSGPGENPRPRRPPMGCGGSKEGPMAGPGSQTKPAPLPVPARETLLIRSTGAQRAGTLTRGSVCRPPTWS